MVMAVFGNGGGGGESLEWTDIEVSLLTVGQILASDIYSGEQRLLAKGSIVTEGFIAALGKRGITKVRVSVEAAADIEKNAVPKEEHPSKPARDEEIASKLHKDERKLWQESGIETAVEEELLVETSACVEEVFSRLREGAPAAEEMEEVKKLARQIIEQTLAKPFAAIKLLDVAHYDQYTFRHSVNTGLLFLTLAKGQIPDEKVEGATVGVLLHDVGKTKLPLEIITKQGKLTDEEYDLIKTHPVLGEEILREHGGFTDEALDITRHHHERWDGSGYPDGLAGEEISPESQLTAVADVYDALTTTRSYKEKMDFHSAINIIVQSSGKHFSERGVRRLFSSLGLYPIGTFVRLTTGEIGVVRKVNPAAVVRPEVSVLFDQNFKRLEVPRILDLSKTPDVAVEKPLKMKY